MYIKTLNYMYNTTKAKKNSNQYIIDIKIEPCFIIH